jgi:tetrapyrrole methylase family protein/MazG family protein
MPGGPRTPRIDVVGLGPAGPELITSGTLARLAGADRVFLRTRRHPAAAGFPDAADFDHHYEWAETFDDVYRAMVDDLVAAATGHATVAYAVPGSPTVAERSVELLRAHPAVVGGSVGVVVHPSVSFLDLAFARLGVDPVAAGVTVVDAGTFAVDAAGRVGPLLVAQCWNAGLLSEIKLAVEGGGPGGEPTATLLHHLGLDDEQVLEVAWADLDRTLVPDHLTSLWIPHLAEPVAARLVELDELVHILRERCPWDREQTHGSLSRHLLEESYEVLEAIDEVAAVDAGAAGEEREAVAHLEEELGDLLFQVYFHAALAAEAGRFTLADVAGGVHDKLVSRHPHVFGDVTADTPEEVATNWEALKLAEKQRTSVTEGIPAALPALALAAKLQRKAGAVGLSLPAPEEEAGRLIAALSRLGSGGEGVGEQVGDEVGELLFALVNLARGLGVDAEAALRTRAARFRSEVEERG